MVWHPHIAASSFGLHGFDHIDDVTTRDGEWFAIRAIGGDAVGTFVADKGDSLSAFTIPNGDTIAGPFVQITLTSGEVLAYRTRS